MQVVFCIMMFVLGACFGSFLCCQARRLRLKETGKKKLGARSVCLHCNKSLKWYENIPLVSWLIQRGKCRKCHKSIGVAEFLSEVGVALAFLDLSVNINVQNATPLEWGIFASTLTLILSLAFLAIYDGLYGELPSFALITSIICGAVVLILKLWGVPFTLNPVWSVLILGGLYLLLYLISKGKWVGDGDWLLGTAIGLALASPWLALVTLFISNTLACAVMLPFVKKSKNHHIHFGPFLVIAFVITLSFSSFLESVVL